MAKIETMFRPVSAGVWSVHRERRVYFTLLYGRGSLTSTDISAEDRRSYAAVIAKFDAFFQVRKHIIIMSVPGLTSVVRKKKTL